ncbi:MAG: hypothetical protein VSS75_004805 [Candidatus Parabeggiatoa sp.]|nr:hypothetical protein [Candidatus Parabeggiatoa sp.]
MTTQEQTYQQLILDGIQTLPPNALAEIVDFVYFIRQKCLQPKRFAEEHYETLLQTELQTLSHQEQTHLEQEFADYEKRYPYE